MGGRWYSLARRSSRRLNAGAWTSQSICHEQVMRHAHSQTLVGEAWRMFPPGVADKCGDPRLIERRPVLYAVAEPFDHQCRIIGKIAACIAVVPAAVVLQGLRQV